MFISTLGPGMLGGDRSTIEIRAGNGTHVRVTTPSASRIHARRGECSTIAEVNLRVGAEALLEWLPLPTILQAEARFQQSIFATLDRGAIALIAEIWVPGRLARGECWTFDSVDARFVAERTTGRELVADRFQLRPAIDLPDRLGILHGTDVVFGSLFVLAPDQPCHELEIALASVLPPRAGVTRLPNTAGLLVRAIGDSSDSVIGPLWDVARRAREALFQPRKWR